VVTPLPLLVEQITDTLHARDQALRLEQSVRGIDHSSEVALQALISQGLAAHHRVTREAFYPSDAGKLSHRARCDLVLTPQGQALMDGTASSAACAPEDAQWLELKVAHQLLPEGRRNPRYAAQWRGALIRELHKLKRDPRIVHAALGFVIFTDSVDTLARDLVRFDTLLDEETLLSGFRSQRDFAIPDRIGHTRCAVVLWPLV
jgi:hypothetical protein